MAAVQTGHPCWVEYLGDPCSSHSRVSCMWTTGFSLSLTPFIHVCRWSDWWTMHHHQVVECICRWIDSNSHSTLWIDKRWEVVSQNSLGVSRCVHNSYKCTKMFSGFALCLLVNHLSSTSAAFLVSYYCHFQVALLKRNRMRFRLMLSSISAASAAITKWFFLNISETTNASNFTI